MRCHRHQPQQEMATDSQQHASLAADKDTSQGRALSPERSQQPVWSGLAQEPTGKSAPDHSPRTAAGFLTTENPSKEIPLCEPSNPHSPPAQQSTRPPMGHKSPALLHSSAATPERERRDPTGTQQQPALFKRSKSQQAGHVPKPKEKSKAFKKWF